MENIFIQYIVGIFISAAASLIGVFAVLKRMSLVGDALTHVALPGIALAIFLKIDPILGALIFLFITALGIWLLEYRSRLSVETIVGVFFSASLAAGALFIPEIDLLEALFGDIAKLTLVDFWVTVVASIILIGFILAYHKKLALHMVSQDMAYSAGINPKKLEFVYLMLFAMAVALGIKFVGALLMGALIIIPAAAAKNVARGLHEFMFLSVLFGVVSAVIGIYAATAIGQHPGPVLILIGTGIFIMSFVWRLVKGK